MLDYLWSDGPRLKQQSGVFRLGTDSIMLAHFVSSSDCKKRSAVDLGTGAGILPLILTWNNPTLRVDAIDIQPEAVQLARENLNINSLSEKVNIFEGDLRCHREFFGAGAYDFVVSNPPYYPSGSGKLPEDVGIMTARSEVFCTLDDICKAAGYLTRWGGSFMLIHKPERLADIFRSMNIYGFEPKRLRFVSHKSDAPPNLVLVEGRRGGKSSLQVEAPLILMDEDGCDTDEVRAIYRR
ncbi:MAG: methyltransferase [Oscillospiraceae bacterium]|nr:methyltransferase [Oscillospiraceae bacterium]